ncbi:phosphotriesterase-related protein [Saccharomonospora amisosensis]|uniref:Phosphotriesterase-related protein n=1 Tax=Saccharomonospora amisosensis TaxID=1128677 RepID=A0A7X5ZQG4_9PSEU|nr:phosphotriesterase-related protein [Saccharomonospora amisosensis]NIJ11799.1 phosphotriesterase-related protein [Saccharomonospora amisosensis]
MAEAGSAQRAKQVQTVRGPVSASRLGRVLAHEHIFVLSPEFLVNYPEHEGFREAEDVPEAVRRLNELAAEGIDTIVDPTVVGLGRDIRRIQRVAAEVDLNIVVATGLYTYRDLPHFLHQRGPGGPFGDAEPLVDMFVGDITDGIAGTGVKAGVLKCVTDRAGITSGIARVLRAVAEAHHRTGTPIMTHTHAGSRQGLAQQNTFEAEGVDLSRVLIGHCGDTTDLDYLMELADRGSLLGMDRFGVDAILPFERRVDTVVRLCERGYDEHLVLSHDAACYIDWLPRDRLPSVLPNWHYLHITRDVLPALRQRGVTERQLERMLVDNPRRFLAGG